MHRRTRETMEGIQTDVETIVMIVEDIVEVTMEMRDETGDAGGVFRVIVDTNVRTVNRIERKSRTKNRRQSMTQLWIVSLVDMTGNSDF
jgi:hypothetical protein